MRHIVVSKLGNEPDVFGESLRCGMIGDWETRKLLQVLSDDPKNIVTYYGKAKWDNEKAREHFGPNVQFIESQSTDDANVIAQLAHIDEFHVILGPHAFYNGGMLIPSWESIKKSIVTERLLERVAPQIKLMNVCKDAKLFFYLSDRRFLMMAADLNRLNKEFSVLAQSLESSWYDRVKFYNWEESHIDYSDLLHETKNVEPFRFETLWLYGKDKKDFYKPKELKDNHINLIIPANQVTSDDEIENSRLQKILDFTEHIDDYVVVGKWTHPKAIKALQENSKRAQFLDGMDMSLYNTCLLASKYALVTYNTSDSPSIFIDNWITVKYWECVYNGCITFVEAVEKKNSFIPEELQVFDAKELRDKLRRCETDNKYKLLLLNLQNSLIKPEYFSGQYFNTFIEEVRQNV